ncbi:HAD family hydrolase [uncultured Dokdonia sp.]|uniref:HAD family hydrolase n=1 Tax=uncultured Dokdonia sp. TaxID=575653 RepID=UPI002626D553|nr:HAD family hydrolase [uncultured Dokdonia sp.]
MKKRAFVFDLWNTLVVKEGKKETDLVAEYFDLPRNEVHEWIRISSVGKNGKEKYKVFESLCLENDLEFTKKDADFIDSLYDIYSKEVHWIDGAKELLKDLKKKGYIIGVLSNTTELSHSVIKQLGLDELADFVVLSCDVGYLKPDPRIFQIMLDKIGIESQEAFMIGDKITTDILGAKTVNMDTILFDPKIDNNKNKYNSSINGIVNKISNVIEFT